MKLVSKILLHCLFWVLSFLIFARANALGEIGYVDWIYSTVWFIILIPVFYVSFYSLHLFLVDKTFKYKDENSLMAKWISPGVIYFFASLNILLQLTIHTDSVFDIILAAPFIPNDVFLIPESNNFVTLGIYLTFIVFGLVFAGAEYLQRQQVFKEELAKEKQLRLEAENRTILQQVNPHFLYNTLNAIYAQAVQGSEQVKESLLTLSDLMRYPVSISSKQKWVDFREEFEQIRRYTDLQKLRFTKRIIVLLKDETEGHSFQVPPLLLMIPIENAFKHGNYTMASVLEIRVQIDDEEVVFTVKNPVDKEGEKNTNKVSTGQGIKQLQEGLSHAFGKNYQYQSYFTDGGKGFCTVIRFPLVNDH